MEELLQQLNRLSIVQKYVSPEIVVYHVYESILKYHENIQIKKPMIQNQLWINFPESFSAMNRYAPTYLKFILGKIAGCGIVDSIGRLKFRDPIRLEKLYDEIQLIK
jgi:hypothetical protein